MIRVLTNKMASAWANTTSTSGRIYGIQLVAGGSIQAECAHAVIGRYRHYERSRYSHFGYSNFVSHNPGNG